MDPRIERHAEVLVEDCTGVTEGDDVTIFAQPSAEDLVVAIYERCGEHGANPTWVCESFRAQRAHLQSLVSDAATLAEHDLALIENSDVVMMIPANRNGHELADVDPNTKQALGKAQQEAREAMFDARWVETLHPTAAHAQKAGMNTESYRDFVWDAIDKDWAEQRTFQSRMIDVLDDAEHIRIVSGDDTELEMNITGMRAVNDADTKNMPGGEVFTTPIADSVNGNVLSDMPAMVHGHELRDVYLEFENGEVVDHSASRHEEVLDTLLNTDHGSSRIGELGIGMNRDIDRFTYNMLFDEKMGDTVHLALGDAPDESVPDGSEGEANESVVHQDLIVDMSKNSYIEVDGDIVQRDGAFVFEDDFTL